jgi:hypothetical protein
MTCKTVNRMNLNHGRTKDLQCRPAVLHGPDPGAGEIEEGVMKIEETSSWKFFKTINHDGFCFKTNRLKGQQVLSFQLLGPRGGKYGYILLTLEIARELAKDLIEAADMA